MSTIYTIYSKQTDGQIQITGTSYSNTRSGTGTRGVSTAGTTARTNQAEISWAITQAFYVFDTSAVVAGLAAAPNEINLYITSTSFSREYIAAEPGNLGSALATGDYVVGDDLSSLPQGPPQSVSSSGAYKSFPITDDITRMSDYWVMTFPKDQMDNVAPSASDQGFTAQTANFTGTARDPFLTIEVADPPEGELAVTLGAITISAEADVSLAPAEASVVLTLGDVGIAATGRQATPATLSITLDAITSNIAGEGTFDATTPPARSISLRGPLLAERTLILPRSA